MRGARVRTECALVMKGCLNNSVAVGRFSGSTSRHWCKKSVKSADTLSGCCNVGVPFVAIKYNAYFIEVRKNEEMLVQFARYEEIRVNPFNHTRRKVKVSS